MADSIFDFEKPPVIEVICSVSFRAIELGLIDAVGFGAKLREKFGYTTIDAKAPLPAEQVRFDGDKQGVEFVFKAQDAPPPVRLIFKQNGGPWWFQVQRDRISLNWIKGPSDTYPRFEAVFGRFEEHIQLFQRTFATEAKPLNAQVLELSYINKIEKGAGWNSLDQLGDLFPFLRSSAPGGYLPPRETIDYQSTFIISPKSARLGTRLRNWPQGTDPHDSLRFELVVKGRAKPEDNHSPWRNWFVGAREAIVQGFVQLTSEEVQRQSWKRAK